MKYYFSMIIVTFLMGCKESEKFNQITNVGKKNIEFVLDSLDLQYYPSFSEPLGVCVNFKKQSIRIYPLSEEYYRKKGFLKEYSTDVELNYLVGIDSIVRKI